MSEFDYTASDTDDDAVRKIVGEMSGRGLAPLSDDQKLQRKVWREESHQRHLEQEAEREHRLAIADEAARQEQAEALAEANRQARIQLREQQRRDYEARQRQLDLSALKLEAAQSANWRNMVQGSLRQQHVQSLYGELEKMLSPPPEPEPTIVYVETEPEEDTFCGVKIPRWR